MPRAFELSRSVVVVDIQCDRVLHDYWGFRLKSSGNRSATLEGKCREQQPQQKMEEKAHDVRMVQHIQGMHQGISLAALLRCVCLCILVRTALQSGFKEALTFPLWEGLQ